MAVAHLFLFFSNFLSLIFLCICVCDCVSPCVPQRECRTEDKLRSWFSPPSVRLPATERQLSGLVAVPLPILTIHSFVCVPLLSSLCRSIVKHRVTFILVYSNDPLWSRRGGGLRGHRHEPA